MIMNCSRLALQPIAHTHLACNITPKRANSHARDRASHQKQAKCRAGPEGPCTVQSVLRIRKSEGQPWPTTKTRTIDLISVLCQTK